MRARLARIAKLIDEKGLEHVGEPLIVRVFVKKTEKTPRREIELSREIA
jgi:hypothetical protein